MAKGKTPDTYSTIFDFIFASQKAGRQKIVPGRSVTMPPLSGSLSEAYAQIATAPSKYPIEAYMGDVSFNMDIYAPVMSVQPTRGYKVEAGAGSLAKLLTDPGAFVDKAMGKYQGARKYAQVGGGARFMDSAIFGYMGWRSGLSKELAFGYGFNIFQQDIGFYNDAMGSQPSHLSAYIRQQDAMKNMSELYRDMYDTYGVDEKKIQEAVARSYEQGSKSSSDTDKDLRLNSLRDDLVAEGFSAADADDVAQGYWGVRGDADDQGLWFVQDQGEPKLKKEEERLRRKSLLVLQDRVKLQADREKDPEKKKKLMKFHKMVNDYAISQDHVWAGALGMTVGRAYHINSWLQEVRDKNQLVNLFLLGDISQMGNFVSLGGGLTRNWISYSGKFIEDPVKQLGWAEDYGLTTAKKEGILFDGGPSTIGKFTEAVYYWHPVNIVKGLTWDGRTWAWLARRAHQRGDLDAARRYGARAANMPGHKLRKTFKKIFNKPVDWFIKSGRKVLEKVGFFNFAAKHLGAAALKLPVREIVKQLLIKAITQVVGNAILPGIGGIIGFVADQIISVAIQLASKLVKPAVQMAVFLLWGAIFVVLMLFYIPGSLIKKTFKYQNPPVEITQAMETGPYGEEDWADDSDPDPDYQASCPVPMSVYCTQGPNGLPGDPYSSHARSGSRAVDLAGGWISSNPGIQAPSGGRIVSVRASTTCYDGSNHGGQVVFEDEDGYRWLFAHVRPTVSTGPVDAGTVIGEVQTRAELSSGGCWTGPHVHIQVWDPSGQLVDAEQFLNGVGCSFSCP